MGNVYGLINSGLTNHNSEDYGTFATAKIEKMFYALCCGEVMKNRYVDQCPKCSNYVKWHKESIEVAQAKIKRYLEKCKA